MRQSATNANSTFAIGGVSYIADNFVVTESSVHIRNICAEKPAYRKSTYRYGHNNLVSTL